MATLIQTAVRSVEGRAASITAESAGLAAIKYEKECGLVARDWSMGSELERSGKAAKLTICNVTTRAALQTTSPAASSGEKEPECYPIEKKKYCWPSSCHRLVAPEPNASASALTRLNP